MKDITDKIRKLLALSKSDNPHEAEIALRKATELMEEFQLNHSDLIPDPEITHTEHQEVTGQHYLWASTLAYACAKLFDCTTVNYMSDKSFRFVGDKHNIKCAQLMFWHLFKAWKTICNSDYKRDNPPDRKLYRKSHGLGFATVIYNKVILLTEQRKANINKSTGRDLVVVSDTKVKDYMEQTFDLKKNKPSRSITVSNLGHNKGKEAGDKVSLSASITPNKLKEIT